MWLSMFFKIGSERHLGLLTIHSVKIRILANACHVLRAGLATSLMHCVLESGGEGFDVIPLSSPLCLLPCGRDTVSSRTKRWS